jgi:hypothetical protein
VLGLTPIRSIARTLNTAAWHEGIETAGNALAEGWRIDALAEHSLDD